LHDLPEMVCGPSALSRFDRDVLSVPGAKFLIIFEGINDLTHPAANNEPEQAVTPEQVVGGLKQLIARAHGNHLKVFGATFLPEEGAAEDAVQVETARKATNPIDLIGPIRSTVPRAPVENLVHLPFAAPPGSWVFRV
jgi:hypothetical protein